MKQLVNFDKPFFSSSQREAWGSCAAWGHEGRPGGQGAPAEGRQQPGAGAAVFLQADHLAA